MDTEPSHSRRRLLAGLGTAAVAALGGCVTSGLSMRTEGVDDSDVFESVSLSESWTANEAVGKVKLTERATTEANVRTLAVIDSEGDSVWSDTVSPGQTAVSDARFPVGPATLVAADNSDAFVGSVSVTVDGSSLP